MPSPRAHFVSFANRRYRGALARIRREAERLGRFAAVRVADERELGADYWRRHAATVRRHRRGYGLWTWKPHVVGHALDAAAPGDLVVYCDAGCSLNAEGRPRLEEYLEIAAGHPTGVLAFALDGAVGAWTKRATLAAFGADTVAGRARPMVAATAIVLAATPAARDLVREWEARMGDVRLVDDSPSPGGEHPEFRAHRHDQSLFTLLAYDRGIATLPDETWWPDAWDAARRYPIHARRWKHRLPWTQAWMRAGRRPRW